MSETEETEIEMHEDEIHLIEQSMAEKMQIARNVVLQCEKVYSSKHNKFSHNDTNIIEFTGVCEDMIQMADLTLKTSKTFIEWFKEVSETTYNSLDLSSIRTVVLDLYTKKGQVATKKNVTRALLDKGCLKEPYDKIKLKKDILRHGFTWKRVPRTKNTMLVEKTDRSLKRMEYLTKMRAYRESGKPIVYAYQQFMYYQVVVSPRSGLLYVGSPVIEKYRLLPVDEWANILINLLPPKSVVVLEEHPKIDQIPTPFASKSAMIGWLQCNAKDTIHDEHLHRSDLYTFVKTFKRPNYCYEYIYKVLKFHGHEVVFRPEFLIEFHYLDMLWSGPSNCQCETCTYTKLKEKTLDDWKQFDKVMMNREEAMYQEEILLENVVDKLLTLAKYGELSAEDLQQFDNEKVDDEYYSSIIIH